jgi:hypothetical protein
MNEFIIVVQDKLVLVEKDGSTSTTLNFGFATKFKVKARAEKVAAKLEGAQVVPSFGGWIHGTKRTVVPKQSPINKSTPYRSI